MIKMARPLIWLALLCASLTFTTCAGIRLELIHVDAKENRTIAERMRRATERTHRRLASMGGVTAPVHWAGSTQYIAEYLIGDPPQRAEAIIDTGSNLIWTQCSACRPGCFSQNLSYYDPSLSRTVRPVACNDTACALGFETRCTRDRKACGVLTAYGAGAIAGVLGTETFTFGSEKASLAFGCITATELTPGSLNGASGIIGLGRGTLSLVSQLGDTKFSYCLTPYFSDAVNTSHLFVGASADLSGGGAPVTSVPFVKNPNDDLYDTFYFLPLAGITVGEAKLDVPAAAFDLREVAPGRWAGTLIDSGAPFTRLVDVAYQALRAELARQLGDSVVPLPAGVEGFDLCVAVAQGDASKLVPPLVLHFGSGGGASSDLVVPPENYWGPVDEATACMVVFSAARPNATLPMNETTVIGNYMHQNMHLLYDMGNGVLSFQPADCSSV
ncbi:aspartic proteinase nepenthesin-1 [Setaria italica]|nr:aspartic proteinase nepenthesin-1 [Setaria italica]